MSLRQSGYELPPRRPNYELLLRDIDEAYTQTHPPNRPCRRRGAPYLWSAVRRVPRSDAYGSRSETPQCCPSSRGLHAEDISLRGTAVRRVDCDCGSARAGATSADRVGGT